MGWQIMTGQEKAIVAAFALVALVLVSAVVLGAVRRWRGAETPPTGAVRRRRGAEAPPTSTRFVPHWQLMGMLLLAALGIVAALILRLFAGR